MMSGFDAVIINAVSACVADWRIPAGIGSGLALFWAGYWATTRYPDRAEQGFIAFLCVVVVCCWPLILSAKTNDGIHAVSVPLVSAMIVATLLFATCAAFHLGPAWGSSKRERFLFGFISASTLALLFSGVVTMTVFDSFEFKARASARTSFSDLHPGELFVDPAIVEMSGFKFSCSIDMKEVRCSTVRD
jgi:hypothetical protein